MSDPEFVLDANVFIEARRRYYGLDLCPGFWDCLRHSSRTGRVVSIDPVCRELKRGKDALWAWAKNNRDLFRDTSQPTVVEAYIAVPEWVESNSQFSPDAKSDFLDSADGWAASYGLAHSAIVITHERYQPQAKKRVPLGNVCYQFDLNVTHTFAMLREFEVRFAWTR